MKTLISLCCACWLGLGTAIYYALLGFYPDFFYVSLFAA